MYNIILFICENISLHSTQLDAYMDTTQTSRAHIYSQHSYTYDVLCAQRSPSPRRFNYLRLKIHRKEFVLDDRIQLGTRKIVQLAKRACGTLT
jgi:hypothetical protein